MINNSYYISDGSLTLARLSQKYQVSIEEILNSNKNPSNLRSIETVSTILNKLRPNQKIDSGLIITIPKKSSGSLERKKIHYGYSTILNDGINYNVNDNSDSLNQLADNGVNYNVNDNSNSLAQLANDGINYNNQNRYNRSYNLGSQNIVPALGNINCHVHILKNGSDLGLYYLPVYPQEVSETNSGEFNSVSTLGRSVSGQVYNTSSRQLSLSLQLHEELVPGNLDYIHKLVAVLESACYPEYSNGIVETPEIVLVIGDQFRVRGILTSCSSTWSTPIIDDQYVQCQVSLGITETTGPYSMSEIRKMKAYRDSNI